MLQRHAVLMHLKVSQFVAAGFQTAFGRLNVHLRPCLRRRMRYRRGIHQRVARPVPDALGGNQAERRN